MNSSGVHRPRNLDWKRAAALLYGDWGTSKAYVIGLAFVAAAYASFPIILAVCALTAVVGYNYIVICRHFPDGGGVYSAARHQGRVLAVIGALLLVANFTVTAAMSGWAAMNYLGVAGQYTRWATLAVLVGVGVINYFGPKHTGNFALSLALPMVVAVVAIAVLAAPHLSTANLEAPHDSFKNNWIAFVGVILALSGVEAIANLTGVMKLDAGATPESPRVGQTARRAILPVAVEVVLGTTLLGWAMLSLPRGLQPELNKRWEDMMRFLAEQYGALALGVPFGQVFGIVVGIIVGLLLLSAVNTAIGALIGLLYMMARDGELPRSFIQLNTHGVPWIPLVFATALPFVVAAFSADFASLAGLYAIGVVGAIAVNLGSCVFNPKLALKWYERAVMAFTFVVLCAVELTIAKTKPDALFFVCCILGTGFVLRWRAMKHAGFETVIIKRELAAAVSPELTANFRPNLTPGQSILVAARGMTPVLRYAIEEVKLREGNLYVLYIKELAVSLPGPLADAARPRWQDDQKAVQIMGAMLQLGQELGVSVVPLYIVSENPAATILDISATIGADVLMLGSPHRSHLARLLKGSVVNEVARHLPENIQLVIHG